MPVKYCGNCNPQIDPRLVRKAVDETMETDSRNILVNGCARMCLTRKKGPGAVSVNAWEIPGVRERQPGKGLK